MYNRKQATM